MARTTSAESVQAQISTRKNTIPCQEPLIFIYLFIYLVLQPLGMGLNESIYRLNGPHEITTQINMINSVHYSDVMGVTRLIARY